MLFTCMTYDSNAVFFETCRKIVFKNVSAAKYLYHLSNGNELK